MSGQKESDGGRDERREARGARPRRLAVILLGPPGCGKTTVADLLGSHAGVRAVVAGRLLRQQAALDDPRGREIRRYLEQGELAPTETVTNILIRELSFIEEPILIFDGYPRSPDQISYFLRMTEHLGFHLACAVVLDVSKEVADGRLAQRHRKDDGAGTVAERREAYERETVPVIEELTERYPDHVHRVSAEPQVEVVVRSVVDVLGQEGMSVGP